MRLHLSYLMIPINIPPRIGEARNSLANIDKIKKTFAWKPEVDVEEWIKTQL